MSKDAFTPAQPGAEPEDRSAEIATHLASAAAIADLIEAVFGSCNDGSDDNSENLGPRTLRAAIYTIRQHVEAADELMPEMERYTREQARHNTQGAQS